MGERTSQASLVRTAAHVANGRSDQTRAREPGLVPLAQDGRPARAEQGRLMSVIDEVLAGLLLVAVLAAGGAELYAKAEHAKAAALQDQVTQVTRERDGLSAAIAAQKQAETAAQVRHTAATTSLASAGKGRACGGGYRRP